MPDAPGSASLPVYYASIAETKTQRNSTGHNLVQICRLLLAVRCQIT